MTFGKFNTIPTSLLVYTLAKFLWSLNCTENKSTSSDSCLSLVYGTAGNLFFFKITQQCLIGFRKPKAS